MNAKKRYQQPAIKVVEIEEQIIATSPEWNAQSIDLDLDLERIEEEGVAD